MKKLLGLLLGLSLVLSPLVVSAATVIPTGRAYSGDLTITSGTTSDNSTESNITVLSSSGIASTTVASVSGFAAGQYVMVIQMSGTGVGNYEFQEVRSVSGNSLFFYKNLTNSYQSTGAQVVKVSEYHNVTISGGVWTPSAWNGSKGGVLVAFLTGSLTQTSGIITATSTGGATGNGNDGSTAPSCSGGAGGGGGGNASIGSTGTSQCGSGSATPGTGGSSGGSASLVTMVTGGNGGASNCNVANCYGPSGNGGGIIFIVSASSTISGGTFSASGLTGLTGINCEAGGAGTAGGSIRLPARLNLTIGSNLITATAGSGNSSGCNAGGGSASAGRIATISVVTLSGTSNPTIDTSSTDYVYNVDNDAINLSLGSSF